MSPMPLDPMQGQVINQGGAPMPPSTGSPNAAPQPGGGPPSYPPPVSVGEDTDEESETDNPIGKALEELSTGEMDFLARKTQEEFTRYKAARFIQEQIWIEAHLNFKGVYPSDMDFQDGTSRAFVQATRPRVITGASMIAPIILPPGDKCFTIDPSPNPYLPKLAAKLVADGMDIDSIRSKVTEAARKAADAMSNRVDDGLAEMGWPAKFLQTSLDLCLYGTSVLMGPFAIELKPRSSEKQSIWERVKAFFTGAYQILAKMGLYEQYRPEIEVVSPFDFYPDPSARSVEECDSCIVRKVINRSQLREFRKRDGFNKEAIDKVLEMSPDGNWTLEGSWEGVINTANAQYAMSAPSGRFVCLVRWGWLSGRDLQKAGIEVDEKQLEEQIMAQTWVIGHKVIALLVSELHQDRLPFYVTPYGLVPHSIWGSGLAEMMRDSQSAINAYERMKMDNAAMCLTGDTIVYRHERPGSCRPRRYTKDLVEVTIRDLWEKKGKKNSGLKRNILRSLDESTGAFFGNRLVDVMNNGIKPVYRMTTQHGYSIKATLEHRFWGDSGDYQELKSFSVGDAIAVNGADRLPPGDAPMRPYADYDKIVKIEYVGEEEVFDLIMTAPNHNFVANGFVAHNCAGPQVIIDTSRLVQGQTTNVRPRKVWFTRQNEAGSTTKPIEIVMPECRVGEYQASQDKQWQYIQEQTNIPNQLMGMGGEGIHNRTASGASMQFNAAITPLKSTIYNIENHMITPMMNALCRFYLEFSKDESIRGDHKIIAKGVQGLMAREAISQRIGTILQYVGQRPEWAEQIDLKSVFDLMIRDSGLSDQNIVLPPSVVAQNKQQALQMQTDQANQQAQNAAGIQQQSEKIRAVSDPKDAMMNFVKDAPEGGQVQMALLEEALKMWNFMTPEVQSAFASDKALTHMDQMTQAHGHGMAQGAPAPAVAQPAQQPDPMQQQMALEKHRMDLAHTQAKIDAIKNKPMAKGA